MRCWWKRQMRFFPKNKEPWNKNGWLKFFWHKMDLRIKKKRNNQEYIRLDQKIRRECDRAWERWLYERCDEIERLWFIDKSIVYSRILQLTSGPKNRGGIARKKRDVRIAVGIDKVKQRWQTYTEELFDDSKKCLRWMWLKGVYLFRGLRWRQLWNKWSRERWLESMGWLWRWWTH